jgi:hypothetical protein
MRGVHLWIILILAWVISGCAGILPASQTLPAATQPLELTATLPATLTAVAEANLIIETDTPEPDPTPTLLPTLTATPDVYDYGPDDFPPDINPLTGLPGDQQANLERRPIVIKVTNFPRSVRPQWGLSQADHVYEYYIGDDMSRFVGVFYGNDASRVGPIRSARLFDAHVTRMYHGIFIFGWADDSVLSFLFAPDIKPHLIVERPANCPPLCRIGPKTAYNTLFADTTQIADYLSKRRTNNDRQNLEGLRFTLITPPSGNLGEGITIQYSLVSYHRWEYDRQQGRYFRHQETGALTGDGGQYASLMDSLTNIQVSASNVIVLLTPHQFFKKSASTEIIDQPFMGQGVGYAFRDGQIFPLTWKRDAADRLPELLLPNGSLYPLKPGNTWLEMLGETSHYQQLDDGTWDFEFSIP